jgi:hypothetical protein
VDDSIDEVLKSLIRECGLKDHKDLFNAMATYFKWTVNEISEGAETISINKRLGTIKYPDFDPLKEVKRRGELMRGES